MRYGVFGGTFDPFHPGHLSMITGALDSGKIDKVLVIPSGYPPKKDAHLLTPAPYRYYMTKQALKNKENCQVLSLEVRTPRISYTVHTLSALREQRIIAPGDELFLMYGTDILFEIETWYHPEILFREARLLLACRPGILHRDTLAKVTELEQKYQVEISFFSIEGLEISSREIRTDRSFEKLDFSVRQFVHKNDLYPSDNPLRHLQDNTHRLLFEYGTILIDEISEQRILHSMNTALLAIRYAVDFGADPDEAAIAGLLHDCAKELPLKKQAELANKTAQTDAAMDNAVLHAPAGYSYACERYGIMNTNILSAIRYHTTGRADMTKLEKVIFLADKLEPGRSYTDLTPIRETASYDLDAAVLLCLEAVSVSFARKGCSIHPDSEMALKSLQSINRTIQENQPITIHKEEKMDLLALSQKIVRVLDDKKAVDVELMPVADKTALADYFIIASGTSVTHIKALSDEVEFVLKNEDGLYPDHIEGLSTGRWVLLDYKDIIVHIFHPEERAHYSLEKLWLTKRPDSIVSDDEQNEDISVEENS